MRRSVFGIAISVAAIIAFAVCQSGRVTEVVYHVPAKFRGPIVLLIDEKRGQPVTVERYIVNVNVPESGFLRVRSIPWLGQWVTDKAVRGGIELPVGDRDDVENGKDYFFGLGTTNSNVNGTRSDASVSYIGTVSEMHRISDYEIYVQQKSAKYR